MGWCEEHRGFRGTGLWYHFALGWEEASHKKTSCAHLPFLLFQFTLMEDYA
jgi:hypothetical protein